MSVSNLRFQSVGGVFWSKIQSVELRISQLYSEFQCECWPSPLKPGIIWQHIFISRNNCSQPNYFAISITRTAKPQFEWRKMIYHALPSQIVKTGVQLFKFHHRIKMINPNNIFLSLVSLLSLPQPYTTFQQSIYPTAHSIWYSLVAIHQTQTAISPLARESNFYSWHSNIRKSDIFVNEWTI